MNGSIYSENQYCSYNLALKEMKEKYSLCKNDKSLFRLADALMRRGDHQEAALALERVLQLDPENTEAMKEKGYCEFMCGNYQLCLDANEKALQQNAEDSYALDGYALALYQMGRKKEGLEKMQEAIELTGGKDPDLLQDLHYMLQNSL